VEWAKNRDEISGDEVVCAQTLVYDQYTATLYTLLTLQVI